MNLDELFLVFGYVGSVGILIVTITGIVEYFRGDDYE